MQKRTFWFCWTITSRTLHCKSLFLCFSYALDKIVRKGTKRTLFLVYVPQRYSSWMRVVFSWLLYSNLADSHWYGLLDDTPENVISSKCHPDFTDLSDRARNGSDIPPVLVKLMMFNAWSTLHNIPFTLDGMLCFRTDCLHWKKNNPGVFSPSVIQESIYTLAIPLINVWKWFSGKFWLCLAEPTLFGHLTVPQSANHVPFLLPSGWW